MKRYILQGIRLTVVTVLFFSVVYPVVVYGFAQFAPNEGKGEILVSDGMKYYSNIGQTFSEDRYFWSRPSAVGYNAAGSGGSNKGAANEEYLTEVQARIDTFLVHNPGVERSEVPVDLVTASGSGLDPHISVRAAGVQVKRIAKVRHISEETLNKLIGEHTERPVWGMFGPVKINVLKLNIALDKLKALE